MRYRITVLTVLVAFIAPASSLAVPVTNPIALVVHAGETYWQHHGEPAQPCGGHLLIDTEIPTAALLQADTGSATYNGITLGSWTTVTPSRCTISLNIHAWPNWESIDGAYVFVCQEIAHELGIAYGVSENSIYGSIMDRLAPYPDIVSECANATLRAPDHTTWKYRNYHAIAGDHIVHIY